MSMSRNQTHLERWSSFALRKKAGLVNQVSEVVNRAFHIERTRIIIAGVNPIARLLASELQALGRHVSVIRFEREPETDPENHIDEILLTRAGAHSARCLLSASANNDRNIELCRTALDRFGVPVVIARLQLLKGITSWTRVNDFGMTRISWNGLIEALVPDMVLRPALARLARADQLEQIIETKICLPTFVGRTIDELPLDDCEALAVTRDGRAIPAFHETTLEMGDTLTLVGMQRALNKVRESLASL
jgi:Trk K+ transport system NAD-binding subunit